MKHFFHTSKNVTIPQELHANIENLNNRAKLLSFFPKVNYNQKRNILVVKNKKLTKTTSVH